MARHVLDIFLSSTSEDLKDYRRTVADTLGRLGQFVVRMETFGAKPNKPLPECRQEVARSDALIVIVGHRYGWVPTKKDGGDGRRSITWWEVQWALDTNKPVYAFLIDPTTPWTGAREQDRLVRAGSEAETLGVWRDVRSLADFRKFLENSTTRDVFTTPDQLGLVVATSLFPWLLEHASPVRPVAPGDLTAASVVPSDRPRPAARGRDGVAGRVNQRHQQLYWLEQLHVGSARELIADPKPVRVAIIAGRPRESHAALTSVSITSVATDGRASANTPDDYTTVLSALIAGAGDDFEGVAPGAELLTISVLDENYTSTNASIASAIDRAVLGGARVLCLSLGSAKESQVITNAITDAVEAGLIVVAAAGNQGSETRIYPAALESVLAVGAVGIDGEPTQWTSHGDWVDIMAPGDVLVPSGADGYAQMQGTSWACAIVSGVVALLLQVDPTLKPAAIRKLLTDTAHATRSDKAGARVVDAYRAVRGALQPASQADRPAVRKPAAGSGGVRKVTRRRVAALR
ncbi:Thermophilic serine proteinase precursor [Luteitalea pratensis]|uniref:Thermophilic serine proteinase n=1 Tax=Luteitalea pratensis TaxID=1855912 RepID=A0A143PKQ4_LUTPR|nr:S8 family serine peptidase [Luteitalea pratensis]AMY09081.1 Thermophilic serine proteinase precursor [Luteitalea pratensis]